MEHTPDEPTTQQASTPTSNAAPSPTLGSTPQKKPRRLALIITLILLLAIAGGIAGYMVARFAGLATQPTTTRTVVVETQKAPEKPKHLALLEELSKQISAGDVQNNGSAPAFQPDGYRFGVQPVGNAPSLQLTRSPADAKTTLASIIAFFKTKNYNEKIVTSTTDSTSTLSEYTNADVKCSLGTVYKSFDNTKDPVEISVGCLDTPGYVKLATSMKPFYDAYAASPDGKQSSVAPLYITKGDETRVSKTSGYQTASIAMATVDSRVGGYAALYYQTPDKAWHYFLGTQSDIPCAKFSTADLKKAYLGERCYDIQLNKYSTVQL